MRIRPHGVPRPCALTRRRTPRTADAFHSVPGRISRRVAHRQPPRSTISSATTAGEANSAEMVDLAASSSRERMGRSCVRPPARRVREVHAGTWAGMARASESNRDAIERRAISAREPRPGHGERVSAKQLSARRRAVTEYAEACARSRCIRGFYNWQVYTDDDGRHPVAGRLRSAVTVSPGSPTARGQANIAPSKR